MASDQELEGNLPQELASCKYMMYLSLENNKLKVLRPVAPWVSPACWVSGLHELVAL